MCVGFWSLEHPEYALILCTNRDEYLSRPTANAHFHSSVSVSGESEPNAPILSGRDLQAGGTWFGVNKRGRVALLTNITELTTTTYKSSRGHLVSSFLATDSQSRTQYIENLIDPAEPGFAGFNLIIFSPSSAQPLSYDADLLTNSGGDGPITSRPLQASERQIGGLSNGVDGFDGNEWPKVQKGLSILEHLLSESSTDRMPEEELMSRLFQLLAWQSADPPSNRAQLRNAIQIMPMRITPSLSADAPADGPEFYGTRLATVLLIRRDGRVLFVERDIWQLDNNGEVTRGDPRRERVFRFPVATDNKAQGQ